LFKRTRYQHGSIEKEERKKGPAVWVYRWWEEDIKGKLVHRKVQVGDIKKYPTESAAHAAAEALRLTINNGCAHRSLRRTTINTLWEHYSQEELPLKALSTQDAYIIYAKNWVIPRWGNLPLEEVKTVEVERWLRAAEVADGTRSKIKCVMSALSSHAALGVLFSKPHLVGYSGCEHGNTRAEYGCADQCQTTEFATGPITGTSQTRFSQARISRPAPGISRWRVGNPPGGIGSTALAGLRFRQYVLQRPAFVLLAPRRKPEEHKNRSISQAVAHAPELERCFARMEVAEPLQPTGGLRFPIGTTEGEEAARPRLGVEKENTAGIPICWHTGSGLAHVPTYGWNYAGGNGRASANDSGLLAAQQPSCHQQIFAGDVEDEAVGARQAGRGDYACRLLAEGGSRPMTKRDDR